MARYKVLAGRHVDSDKVAGRGESTNDRIWSHGDELDTVQDLDKFNTPGMQPKFQRLSGDTSPSPTAITDEMIEEYLQRKNLKQGSKPAAPKVLTPQNKKEHLALLETMSVKELQSFAAAEEIDLKGLNDKRKIIDAISAAI